VGGDGKAETRALPAVLVARGIQADKGADRLVPTLGRDAGAVILDGDAESLGGQGRLDLGAGAVADGVADQVLDRAPQAAGTYGDPVALGVVVEAHQGHVLSAPLGIADDLVQEGTRRERFGRAFPSVRP